MRTSAKPGLLKRYGYISSFSPFLFLFPIQYPALENGWHGGPPRRINLLYLCLFSAFLYPSIGKSLTPNNDVVPPDYFDLKVVESAYNAIEHAGFLRTLLMPRFMEVLLKNSWYERDLFMDAAISCEDLKVLQEFSLLNFSLSDSNFILIGHQRRCRLLKYFLAKHCNIQNEIQTIYKKEEIDQLGINGAISIAEKAGYLKKR